MHRYEGSTGRGMGRGNILHCLCRKRKGNATITEWKCSERKRDTERKGGLAGSMDLIYFKNLVE